MAETFYRLKGDTLWTRVTGASPITVSGLTPSSVYEYPKGDGTIGEVTAGASVALPAPYTGAEVVLSLRDIAGSGGNLIRAIRSGDQAARDFTAAEIADTGATGLQQWVLDGAGTENGYLLKVYDQSGNGNDAVEFSLGSRAPVVESGILVTKNGFPAVKTVRLGDGNPCRMDIPTLQLGNSASLFFMIEHIAQTSGGSVHRPFFTATSSNVYDPAGGTFGYGLGSTRNGTNEFRFTSPTTSTTFNDSVAAFTLAPNNSITSVSAINDNGSGLLRADQGTDATATFPVQTGTLDTGYTLFRQQPEEAASGRVFDGLFLEMVAFNSAVSPADRTAIENDQIAAYTP